ncbi:TlpA disulfide reductase family protein [Hufsiella ginkgonis]|uniref:Redoxin domain-containing protein n=1 Tax=Hufsiella ginkgonis TaxID=2695274 RepID=A0A7K1XUD9_9SPHI|nr:TlpA disulfide reductase family protein [Hufsiella ginkgonis]MXV14570.1 redoxin domain-containing protein [Hufsiella ginkgonis]
MKTLKSVIALAFGVVAGNAAFPQAPATLQLDGRTPVTGKVYLQKFQNKMFSTIDSSKITNGKFRFATPVQLPELYGLTFDKDKAPYFLFLDNPKAEISLDSAKYFANTTVKGSAAQDLFSLYKTQRGVKIDEFIKAQPASIVSAYVLYRDFSYRLTPEEIESNVALLDKSLAGTQYVQVLNGLPAVLRKVAVGNKAPDFTSTDVNGKSFTLSQNLGKYILLDFWAAWCGPCRRENPNVVKAFEKYKDRGFTVIGVSLDKSKAAWVKAIKDDGLNWTQVSDLKYWDSEPAKLFAVRAIPGNFLIAPDGTIVGRNLRGAELQQKLEELLGASAANAAGK